MLFRSQLEERASAGEVARIASRLGMRPNPHPAFLVLPEGRVVGEPKPVSGSEQKILVVKTPEQIAAEKKAAAAKAKAAAEKKAAEERAAAERKKADKAAEKKAAEKKAADKKKQNQAAAAEGEG